MRFYNPCKKCGGPISANNVIDLYGNKVISVGCWNGHYEKMEIEGIESNYIEQKIKEAIPFIGLFYFQ